MSPPSQSPSVAAADRQLVRRVLGVFVLAGAVAVGGPLLSYRGDLSELREVFRSGLSRDADVQAQAFARHLRVLEAELERLARRPEIDLRDNTLTPEQELLDFAHRGSALFGPGILLVDHGGETVWSEPAGVLTDPSVGERAWFRRMLRSRAPEVDVLHPGSQVVAVASPIVRGDRVLGAVVGLLDARKIALPAGPPEGAVHLLLIDERGGLLLPAEPSPWMKTRPVREAIEAAAKTDGGLVDTPAGELFAAVAPVEHTGLRLVLLASESAVTSSLRQRFLLQMVTIVLLQTGAVLVMMLFLRRIYRRFLAVERRAVEHERLLALGTAASLIAHEVKNSLNGMKAASSLLVSGGEPSLPVRTLRGQIDRLQHLAASLLEFGRPASAKRRDVDLPALVSEVVEAMDAVPESEDVELGFVGGPQMAVHCDPLLVATAVHNLVRNAVEAAAAAKDLGRLRDPRVEVRIVRRQGTVAIEVEDNAGGPPDELDGQLFEPFVTAKPKGVGLGLSMARRALEEQGGRLLFARTERGSCFTAELPHAVEEMAA